MLERALAQWNIYTMACPQVAAFMESRMAATLRAALAEVDRSDNAAVEAAAQVN